MKTVFNTDEAIHVFAQQSQTDIKNQSRNIFCKRSNCELDYADEIYSYGHHYLLGKFIDNNTILINDKGYSVTTSKHISKLSYATYQYRQFFTTETDLKYVLNSCKELYNKWSKARKPQMYSSQISRLFKKLNEYLEYTKQKVKRSKEYREIKKIHDIVVNSSNNDLEKFRKNQQKAIRIKERKEFNKKLNEFFNHKTNYVKIGKNEDYLRLSKDKTQVETTQGVKIGIGCANALYNLIEKEKDIKGYKIGYYTVIGLNGTLKIGCHNINKKNMHQIGKEIKELLKK